MGNILNMINTMKIAIVDTLGLCYDGNTLSKRGLGGSESAVIYIAKELAKLDFEVTVFNNCIDSDYSSEGYFDKVTYIDNRNSHKFSEEQFDFVIVSRSVLPFITETHTFIRKAKKKILWLHDTFIEGDQILEDLILEKKIDHIFTLSDWHTSYILNSDHGKRRNYEVLKRSFFQTRNGAFKYDVGSIEKDRNQFVYNASATKGMVPLLELIWPKIKEQLPGAKLTIIGGYYRFRELAEPDAQEKTVSDYMSSEKLKELDVTFTGIISQEEIAKILAKSNMMLFPGAFPETFGISTLESLLYKTPLVTTRFGALEETALDLACYKIDYAIQPNGLFPFIDIETQVDKFVDLTLQAYHNEYLLQQKREYCEVVTDIAGWDTVALQWKQFLYQISGKYLSVSEYRKVSRINSKVNRVFGRVTNTAMPVYTSHSHQRRIIVVSPFRNAEQYIKDHIESVSSQDYDNYVHVLIDDNSTDKSVDVVHSAIEGVDSKIELFYNSTRRGAIRNQLDTISRYADPEDIVILLDGDDSLVNNNSLFHFYNDLYDQGYEFTYGSMWSMADKIPLIAQEYPAEVKETKSYREHLFNWKIPYTHLRTCLAKYFLNLDESKFKDENGDWMKSGHDNPLFYELIEQIEPEKIYCNKEIVLNYNDLNPLNDYKVNGEEQNKNANTSYKKDDNIMKTILIAIPTNKNIEAETFKSIYDLIIPEGYRTEFQYFHGYLIDQIRNLIAEWGKHYDYLFSVDSDIVLPRDTLVKMLKADKDIISGLYIQRKPGQEILEVYGLENNGRVSNIPVDLIEKLPITEIMACGMGCCLINSAVLRKMEYPHFYYKSALRMEDTVSEDVYFCLKARDIGFTVWADPSIRCDHIGSTKFVVKDPIQKNIEKVYEQDLLPHQHQEYLKINKHIEPKVIYDIGSCVLHWSRHAKEVWPDSKIYHMDANYDLKPLYDKLNLDYFLGVLSSESNKEVDFYYDPYNLGGNSYYKEREAYSEIRSEKRPTVSLDDLMETYNWEKPDLIKMDVQGAELDILKGATKALATCSDLILECQHADYNENAPKVQEVVEYLEKTGFKLISNFTSTNVDGDYHFKKIV